MAILSRKLVVLRVAIHRSAKDAWAAILSGFLDRKCPWGQHSTNLTPFDKPKV